MRIGTGLSASTDPREGATAAAQAARDALGGLPCDVALVFCTGQHLAAPEVALGIVRDVLAPQTLAGCGAGGVLAGRVELERGTAITVWAASLEGRGSVTAFALDPDELLPADADSSAVVLLCDPYSYPADEALAELHGRAAGVPVLGGVSSARALSGEAALFCDEDVLDSGAVGLVFADVDVVACVSQGAAPLGPELTITDCDENVVLELAGRPALETLRDVLRKLPDDERALIDRGLLLGIVIAPNKPDYVQGDFLVRGLLGADQEAGSVTVAHEVRPGTVVRLHARDAASASRDLRTALADRRDALGGRSAGALVFSCNGRGTSMFGHSGHDAEAVSDVLDGAAVAGFFAAGEIGPVAGRPFLHTFTATVAVFGP